jgi:single-strand DNA-binding protein
MYINKAIIAGNVTRDPELKSLPSGVKITTFSVATNRFWKDATTGERKEMAEYHNIVVFGRQAENCAQYVKKGSQYFSEGRIQTRSWEQDGQKKYRTEIIAENVQFGSRPQLGNWIISIHQASISKNQMMHQLIIQMQMHWISILTTFRFNQTQVLHTLCHNNVI